MPIFSPKTANEAIRLTFDFANAISNVSEVITTSTWTVSTLLGIDATPSTMLNLPITLNNSSVSRIVSGGISGNTYKIEVIVTTSANQIFELSGTIKIS